MISLRTYQSRQKDMSVNMEFRNRIMPWVPNVYHLSVSGISDPEDGTTLMNARPIHIPGSSFGEEYELLAWAPMIGPASTPILIDGYGFKVGVSTPHVSQLCL